MGLILGSGAFIIIYCFYQFFLLKIKSTIKDDFCDNDQLPNPESFWKPFKSKDAAGRNIYWLTGKFENRAQEDESTDEWALANNFASIVPVKIDMTAYDYIPELQKWEFIG